MALAIGCGTSERAVATLSSAKLHYAWIVAGVTFLILLATAGVRATPAIFMVPLEHEFGWTRAAISGAIAINIALFGIIGPFAASLMSRYGLRRIVLGALALLAVAAQPPLQEARQRRTPLEYFSANRRG